MRFIILLYREGNKMRKLNTSDIFAALRVIRAANLREELKPLLKRAAEGSASLEDVGIDGIISAMEMMAEKKAERAVYEVLAGPLEISADEVAALDILDFAQRVEQIAKENDLKAFFGYVSGILGKK